MLICPDFIFFFFSLAAKLIGLRTECQFFEKIVRFTTRNQLLYMRFFGALNRNSSLLARSSVYLVLSGTQP